MHSPWEGCWPPTAWPGGFCAWADHPSPFVGFFCSSRGQPGGYKPAPACQYLAAPSGHSPQQVPLQPCPQRSTRLAVGASAALGGRAFCSTALCFVSARTVGDEFCFSLEALQLHAGWPGG